jgi:hypothetical protein
VTIKVMITDSKIGMTPKRAQRGVMARFILINRGVEAHTFKLGHERRGTGTIPVHEGSQAERAEASSSSSSLPRQASVSRPSSSRPSQARHEGDIHDLLIAGRRAQAGSARLPGRR